MHLSRAELSPLDILQHLDDLLPYALVAILGISQMLHRDRIRAAADLEDRGIVKVLGETRDIDGRRSHDHLEIGPPRQQLFEVAQ